jgi:NTE family protein
MRPAIIPSLVLLILLLMPLYARPQKVALVLSGGGAKGIAYVRIIKVLEANGIPIDYVVGTSIGGLVGAFYAAGYSPEEMETLVLSNDFQNWVNGRVDNRYFYYLYRREPDGAALNLKVGLTENFGAVLQASLINDDALNMALTERLAPASAKARYSFDSLFVPFRCMAADVFSQQPVMLCNGHLSDAARATMNVPLFFKPVKVYNQYLFDGGIYNNFPVDVAKREFNPDVIIGVNVSSNDLTDYPYDSDDEYLAKMMSYILIAKSDSTQIPANSIYIKPQLGSLTATQFDRVGQLLEVGTKAIEAKLEEVKAKIARRVDKESVEARRRQFRAACPPLRFSSNEIQAVGRRAPKYVEKMSKLRPGYQLDQIKRKYFRISQSEHFDLLYPQFLYNDQDSGYRYRLQFKPADHFKVSLGGVIATRNISQLYLGLRYDYADQVLYNFAIQFYTGPFYSSGNLRARFNFPGQWAYYIEPSITFNRWDYLRGTEIFNALDGRDRFALTQEDGRFDLDLGAAAGSRGKITAQYSHFFLEDSYSHFRFFTSGDTLNTTAFEGDGLGVSYQQGSLNRKMYASAGGQVYFVARFIQGRETYTPGSDLAALIGFRDLPESRSHRWIRLKLAAERYFAFGKRYSLGLMGEGVYSTQPIFANYISTMAVAPAFAPLQDSRTLFLPEFRSFRYLAGGLRAIARFSKNLELRTEGYGFVNMLPILEIDPDFLSISRRPVAQLDAQRMNFRKAGTASLVYHSVAGPISFSVNYYDDINPNNRWGVLLHAGFLVFNKKPFD